jgi:hypothetical protein
MNIKGQFTTNLKRLSIPVLLCFTIVFIFYLLCLKIGSPFIFYTIIYKTALSLCGRAVSCFLLKIGFSSGLALAIGFGVRALLTTEALPSLANSKSMLPAGTSGASSSEAGVTQAPQSNGGDAGPSSTPSSEASVNQQPLIPELNPPLLSHFTRHQELNERLGLYWVGLSHSLEVRESFVQTQLQIERHIEAALVDDGYSRNAVLQQRHQIRGWMFYPQGAALSESTYLDYLKQIQEYGTRNSVPYRRIEKAIKNYDLHLVSNLRR